MLPLKFAGLRQNGGLRGNMNIKLKKAVFEDIDAIIALNNKANENLVDPSWFCMDDPDFIVRHIEQEGFILKAVDNQILAGFLIVRYPNMAEDNLGIYQNQTEDQMKQVAHMETVVISKEYQGNKLQLKLMKAAEEALKDTTYQYFFATVHPDNQYSLNNFISLNYNIITTVKKYGGLDRHILYKEK